MEPNDPAYIKYLADRIAVLEQLVEALVRATGAPEAEIRRWQEHIANWPDTPRSLTEDTIRLVETVSSLARQKHELPNE